MPSPQRRPAASGQPPSFATGTQRAVPTEPDNIISKRGELAAPLPRYRRWIAFTMIAAIIASPFVPAFPTWLGIAILGLCATAFVESAAEHLKLSSKIAKGQACVSLGSRVVSILPSLQTLSRRILRLDSQPNWKNYLGVAMYCVAGGILILMGRAGAASQAEQEIAAARHAAENAEQQQLIEEANSKVRTLVQEADAAVGSGDFIEAYSRLERASVLPHATDSNLIRAANVRVANAQVVAFTAEAIKALNAGDIATGKQKVHDALTVANADKLGDVAELEQKLVASTDPARIREVMLELPDEAFQELSQSHTLPASFASGYPCLDTRAAELAIAAMEAVAELRETRRLTRLEEEKKQLDQSRLAAEELARKAELERKNEEKKLAAGAEAGRRDRNAVRRGGTAYLEVEGENEVWVSVNEEAHDELNSFSSAKNEEAIIQMMQQGRVLVCAKQTRVSIVDPGFFSTTVRIMDGKHAGATGIVPNEFLQAEPANASKTATQSMEDRKSSPIAADTVIVRSSSLVDFVSPATGKKMLMMIVMLKNNGSTPVRVVDADITWSDAAGNVIRMQNYTIYAEFDSAPGIVPGGTWKTRKGEGFIIPYGPGIGEKAKSVKVEITKVLERSDL